MKTRWWVLLIVLVALVFALVTVVQCAPGWFTGQGFFPSWAELQPMLVRSVWITPLVLAGLAALGFAAYIALVVKCSIEADEAEDIAGIP